MSGARVPAGVPTGGQFTATSHSESSASLGRPLDIHLSDVRLGKTADHDPEPGLGGAAYEVSGPGGSVLGRVESQSDRTDGVQWLAKDLRGEPMRYGRPAGEVGPVRTFEKRSGAVDALLGKVNAERRAAAAEPVETRIARLRDEGTHQTLGDLRLALRALDRNLPITLPDGRGVGEVGSYRGYYEQLAIEPFGDYSTVGEFLERLDRADGEEFIGYKGGRFRMSDQTPLWVAWYGDTGEKVVGVVDAGDSAVLVVGESDEYL